MVRHFGLADDPLIRQRAGRPLHRTSRSPATRTSGRMDKIKAGQLPGPGDVDRQAGAHPEHAAHRPSSSPRVLGPRMIADTRRVGHLRLGPVRARHPRHAHRRRHRRGHAQHRRRARARPAQGAGHRLEDPLPRPAPQLTPHHRCQLLGSDRCVWRAYPSLERARTGRGSGEEGGLAGDRVGVAQQPLAARQAVHEHPRAAVDRRSGRSPASATLCRGHG